MDIYTTSFTYPRVPNTSLLPTPLRYANSIVPAQNAFSGEPQNANDITVDVDAIQKLVMATTSAHGCLVTFTKSTRKGWNFHLSGSYQQVIAARGSILRDCPVQVRGMVVFSQVRID